MGAHLDFGDESIFRARGFQTTAWVAPRQNVVVEDRTDHQPCQAVCAAVCACHGVLTYAVEEYSFNRWKFIDFLRQLRGDAGDETIYLFLDQASYHKEQSEVAPEFEKLDIVPVWNVPYRFEFNAGIERWWAVLKVRFRPLLLKKMLVDLPRRGATPLKDALLEVLRDAP